jgi:hypothetical protein
MLPRPSTTISLKPSTPRPLRSAWRTVELDAIEIAQQPLRVERRWLL